MMVIQAGAVKTPKQSEKLDMDMVNLIYIWLYTVQINVM
jgi:hypothetical protein